MKHQSAKTAIRSRRDNSADAQISKQQIAIRKEFCEAYSFAAEQIGFSHNRPLDPIFDFDALNVLVNTLADIPEINVDLDGFNEVRGTAKSFCEITLPEGSKRKIFGVGVIGEELHDGSKITGMKQAIDISRARCLRAGLRAVGFDAVRAHEMAKRGERIDLLGSTARQRKARLAEIHILAGPRGLNLITKEKNREHYEMLLAQNFDGRTTSKDLDPGEVAEWCGMLRAWTRGMEKAA